MFKKRAAVPGREIKQETPIEVLTAPRRQTCAERRAQRERASPPNTHTHTAADRTFHVRVAGGGGAGGGRIAPGCGKSAAARLLQHVGALLALFQPDLSGPSQPREGAGASAARASSGAPPAKHRGSESSLWIEAEGMRCSPYFCRLAGSARSACLALQAYRSIQQQRRSYRARQK